MTNYEFADVVLVSFPQSGSSYPKKRPGVVVLDIGDADVVVAPVWAEDRPDRRPGENLSGSWGRRQ